MDSFEQWSAAVTGERISPEAVAAFRAHPNFPAAVRAASADALTLYGADAKLSRALSDTGTGVMSLLSLHLHADGGLTLARIQTVMDAMGTSSRGRAAAFLKWLRAVEYVVPAEVQPDRRSLVYLPTPAMWRAVLSLLHKDLAALALIEPQTQRLLALFDREDVSRRFVVQFGSGLLAANAADGAPSAVMTVFASRNAGILILYDLLLSGPEGDCFPPHGPIRLSVSALSQRFNVSRSHVLRLLRAAEEAGMLQRDARTATGLLKPPLHEAVALFHAHYFIGMAACARRTLEALD